MPKGIVFRKVSSPEALTKLIAFLTDDVKKHGGSASETIDMHGQLWDITVSSAPWGIIVIKTEIDRLEALAIWFGAIKG